MIGLKKGTVKLFNHEKEWELEAQRTIFRLHKILGTVARDIQHVGSTSIPTIKAKPIIDIAVAVDNFKDVLALEEELESNGFYYCPNVNLKDQLFLPAVVIMMVRATFKRTLFILFYRTVWNG